MAAKFKLKRAGVGEMLRSDWMRAEMVRRAELIKAAAEGIAPVGPAARDPHPGRYKASFTVTSRTDGGLKGDRATATVTNTSPYARWVEYGGGWGGSVPARHVLLRAAQAGGG